MKFVHVISKWLILAVAIVATVVLLPFLSFA